ncbi:MAG TPA: ABC-2 transporter permease [Lachnospiraceae bacterium]|nr:ABC-2 transporter permease [Lachnospiraceae bacterium]
MKYLYCKEWKLTVVPVVYVFMSFVLMLLIPGYPYTVSFFYTGLGIFLMLVTARENKDILYMSTLPVAKKDIVKARYLLVISIEMIQIILCIPIAILRGTVLLYDNAAGIDADLAFFGIGFLMFAVYNRMFFSVYFKDVYKVGTAFLYASIAEFVIIVLTEVSVHVCKAVAGSCFWDSMKAEDQIKQIPILIVGIIVFVISTFWGLKTDIKRFEKLDL